GEDIAGRHLAEAIRRVAAGDVALDPRVLSRVVAMASRGRSIGDDRPLSSRELDALRLVARGATNLEIANALGVTQNTSKTLLRRAMDKVGCHRRSEAAATAVRLGLL